MKLIGNREDYGRFRITQIAIGKYKRDTPENIEVLLPAPAHLLQDEHGKRLRLVPRAISDLVVETNQPEGITHLLALRESGAETKLESLSGWISQSDLRRVLRSDANLEELKIVKPDEVYERESRLGMSMDSQRKRTRDGFLYQQQLIRMQPKTGFVVDIGLSTEKNEQTLISDSEVQEKLFSKKTSGWLIIGGDQRAAYFRVIKTTEPPDAQTVTAGNLVYLATPAYFSTAWKPSARFAPLDQPITAAISRPEAIGGWRLNTGDAQGDQKGLRFCVPAGSVFFYDQQVPVPQWLTRIRSRIGYGITYTGDWKE